MTAKRIPLVEEPISGRETVERYDRYSGKFIMPEYRYFVRKILTRKLRSGEVLDIGTGSGRLAVELAKTGNSRFKITGLDVSGDMLLKAVENARAAGVAGNIQWVQATGSSLPWPDNSFDLVISYASLHHWQNPVAVLDEAWRVTRPGGLIIIRDNRRIYGNTLLEALAWTIMRFMNREQRKLWPKSMQASYTLPEVKELLEQTKMQNYRVGADFVNLDVCIEVIRKPETES